MTPPRGVLILLIAGALPGSTPLAAQYARCTSVIPSPGTQGCQVAVDAARAFQPLAGIVISGGATLLGGGTLGTGHFSITTRVNAVGASIPDANSSTATSIRSIYSGLIPAPIVEAGVGVWRRLDLFGSTLLLPTGLVSGLTVGPNAPHLGNVALGLGLGARFTVLQQPALPLPSVTISVARRWMPEIRYGDPPDTSQPNRYQFSANLQATNARIQAGWRLGLWDAGVGLGLDHYHSHIRASGQNTGFGIGGVAMWDTGPFDVATTRAVVFLNSDVRLERLQIVGEAGYVGGTSQTFTTNFADFDPKAGHLFGGLGLRFGF